MDQKTRAPRHLQPTTRRWWSSVVADFELEDHHRRLLTMCAEFWDTSAAARALLAEHGLTFMDRHGTPRARPEVSIERDAKIGFARLLRELGLDVLPPSESRPVGIAANAYRKVGG